MAPFTWLFRRARTDPGPPRVSWAALQASDLFAWFNMSETSRCSATRDITTVHVEPGAFREFIDLRFDIGSHGDVIGFRLALDRNWLDGAPTGMTTGADLAASVVRSVSAADPVLAMVADALMAGGIAASRSPVFVRLGSQLDQAPGAEFASLVKTFTTAFAPPSTVQGRRSLHAANVGDGERLWFVVTWR